MDTQKNDGNPNNKEKIIFRYLMPFVALFLVP